MKNLSKDKDSKMMMYFLKFPYLSKRLVKVWSSSCKVHRLTCSLALYFYTWQGGSCQRWYMLQRILSEKRGIKIMNFSQDWATRHNKICRGMIFHPKHLRGAAFSNTLPNIHASLRSYISHSNQMPHICGLNLERER